MKLNTQKITLKDFRIIQDMEAVELAPVTLLVGENSSGKSSFLAGLKIANQIICNEPVNFNEEPFLLGSYDEIAHFHGGTKGRAKSFQIEIAVPFENTFRRSKSKFVDASEISILAEFTSGPSEPYWSAISITVGKTEFQAVDKGEKVQFRLKSPRLKQEKARVLTVNSQFRHVTAKRLDLFISFAIQSFMMQSRSKGKKSFKLSMDETFDILTDLQDWLYMGSIADRRPPIVSSPIRSKPKRTYDPVADTPSPDGGHVPMSLSRMHTESKTGGSANTSKNWQAMKDQLDDFGKKSGLFKSINLKRHGKKGSNPFQIQTKVGSFHANIADVGYGVSQVLPILVDAFQETQPRQFIYQQPEVHLHPKAQAELGSLFSSLHKSRGHQFVVETHSDYIVDRLRIEARDNKDFSHKDVVILFFERIGPSTQIHRIEIDENGDLVNTPKGFRDFFLLEQSRFLGI